MSSLARRSLRTTTVAAAGIAALGAGFAGHAFAQADLPVSPSDAFAGGGAGAVEPVLASLLPASSGDLKDLPMLFSFEAPAVTTASAPAEAPPGLPDVGAPAGPAAPELPVGPGLPEVPTSSLPAAPGSLNDVADPKEIAEQVNVPDPDTESIAQNNQTAALPSLDDAKMVTGLAGKVFAGEPLAESNSIG
ncbi:MAG: hypothetical protein ACR2GH_01155 [Pseudonocardia sp.]